MFIETKYKMNDELRIWLLNGTTLFISFQDIDLILKLLLVVVSIGYTITKWYQMVKKDPTIFPNPFKKDEEKE